jgi:Raf kinase inhibitor-like YbhB/YbcL family protein
MAGIQVRSSAFEYNDLIPHRYSMDGENVSPDLEWAGVPAGAAELLLLCEDPDAPRRTILHWLVTGIDPACAGVESGDTPKSGRVWCNDFGQFGYSGPQRPVGDQVHRYFFRVFALAEPVRLPRHPSAANVHLTIRRTELTSGALIGRYQRSPALRGGAPERGCDRMVGQERVESVPLAAMRQ